MSSGQAWCADPANVDRLRAAEERSTRREQTYQHLSALAMRPAERVTDENALSAFRAWQATFDFRGER